MTSQKQHALKQCSLSSSDGVAQFKVMRTLVSPELVYTSFDTVVSLCCTFMKHCKSELVYNWQLQNELRIVDRGQYLSIRHIGSDISIKSLKRKT